MLKREVLTRCFLSALCAVFVCSAWAFSPGSAVAAGKAKKARAAMSDAEFVELCREGTAGQVKQALKNGANPNAKDEDGNPALLLALRNEENPDVLKALLNAGADPNAKDEDGGTLLHEATLHNHDLSVVQSLLKAGADPNAKSKYGGNTPLWYAVKRDNLPVVRALLKAGADPNAKDEIGRTALTHGALFDSGGDAGCPGPTAEVYKAMLEAGADVNGGCREDAEDCVTPLENLTDSCSGDDAASVRALLEGGAGKHRKGLDRALVQAPLHGTPETMDMLLKAGANPNAKAEYGQTALMNAARFGKPRIVALLFEAGADKNVKDDEGHDALWHARHPAGWLRISKADQAEVVRLLGGDGKKSAPKKKR